MNSYHTLLSLLSASLFCLSSCHSSEQGHAHSDEHDHAHGYSQESDGSIRLTHQQAEAIGIELKPLERKAIGATIRASGALLVPNSDKAYITALYGGQIQQILVHPGDHVRKGQTIAILVNPQFIQIQEEYLDSKSRLSYAQAEYERQRALDQAGVGVLRDLQSAQAEWNGLQARYASLQTQLHLLGVDTERISSDNIRSTLSISSPIAGVVSSVMTKVGSYADTSTPIAEVVDNSALHLELNVYEQDINKIHRGQVIHYRLINRPSNEYHATVESISSTFQPDSRTIAVHCSLIGDRTGLIDGMNITGIISLGDIMSDVLPNEAIVTHKGKDYAYMLVVNENNEHHTAETNDHHDEHAEHTHENKHHDQTTPKEGIKLLPVEVIRGSSELGYTAVTFLKPIPQGAKFVHNGIFFVHAIVSNDGSAHSH